MLKLYVTESSRPILDTTYFFSKLRHMSQSWHADFQNDRLQTQFAPTKCEQNIYIPHSDGKIVFLWIWWHGKPQSSWPSDGAPANQTQPYICGSGPDMQMTGGRLGHRAQNGGPCVAGGKIPGRRCQNDVHRGNQTSSRLIQFCPTIVAFNYCCGPLYILFLALIPEIFIPKLELPCLPNKEIVYSVTT